MSGMIYFFLPDRDRARPPEQPTSARPAGKKERHVMKLAKWTMAAVFTLAAGGFALADKAADKADKGAEKPKITEGSCCDKAKKKGEECKHPCCVEAAKKDTVCTKCNKQAGE